MTKTLAKWAGPIVLTTGLGCGGSNKPAPPPPPQASPCAAMAAHLRGNVAEGGEISVVVEKVSLDSCEGDGWSAEAIDCMTRTTIDPIGLVPEQTKEEKFGGCGAFLTEAQLEGISTRFVAEVDARSGTGADEPDGDPTDFDVPPPPPPPPPKTN